VDKLRLIIESVSSTPTFFFVGKKVKTVVPFDEGRVFQEKKRNYVYGCVKFDNIWMISYIQRTFCESEGEIDECVSHRIRVEWVKWR
jgi:hypothetical protein